MRYLLVILSTVMFLLGPSAANAAGAMVSTANPHASQAAAAMLKQGGSAVDAAIAAQLVLSLVEPQSSGIGGGAFLLHFSGKDRRIEAYDGREKAPAGVTSRLFLQDNGEPMGFMAAVVGGRAVGVPGVIKMLELAHKTHGNLDWQNLFAPAIKLAEEGFAVSPRMSGLLARFKRLRGEPTTQDYFYVTKGGVRKPLPAGHLLKNANYAETLRTIARNGANGFYSGPVAQAIVDAVRGHASNPGTMTLEDLAAYDAKRREPVCAPYRRHTVCGMPPPTSGGLTSLMILKMLERFDMGSLKPSSLEAVHLISEASRLAFADRGVYMADSDFVDVPVAGLLNKEYLAARSALIDPAKAMASAAAGTPPGVTKKKAAADDVTRPGTTHLSIVDEQGNAVSMTSSVEGGFGAHLMAGGFLLNNQLTDFSFQPERDGMAVANRVEPGKRPRSSMSPSLILNEDGTLFAAIGSPGGSRIIGFVTKAMIGLMDWKLTVQEAINLPHHINRNGKTDLEKNTNVAKLARQLEAMGHRVRIRGLNSGLHGIRLTGEGLDGGADPRREGTVITLD
ncbi:MAG: gamma-glutamyltransferase [Rhizobiales bacterium]|nr:gamma-glutamyltransferase [Hyphomicrobiales bacterium]